MNEHPMNEHPMTESRTVNGYVLDPLGMVAGRTIYRFTSHGAAYRLTPDLLATYLLRRPADGYAGVFGTIDQAVAYADALDQGEGEDPSQHRGHDDGPAWSVAHRGDEMGIEQDPRSNTGGTMGTMGTMTRTTARYETAAPRLPMRERKRLQTRAAIIASAVALFNTRGYHRTTIDEIAEMADVSRGTFFNYFDTKEATAVELGRDLFADLAARAAEQLAAGWGAERIVRRLWRAAAGLRAEQGTAVGVLARELLDPDTARAADAAVAFPLAELVATVTAAGQRAGQLRADLDPALFGALVADLIVAGMARHCDADDPGAADAAIRQGLDVLFRGARCAGAAPGDDREAE